MGLYTYLLPGIPIYGWFSCCKAWLKNALWRAPISNTYPSIAYSRSHNSFLIFWCTSCCRTGQNSTSRPHLYIQNVYFLFQGPQFLYILHMLGPHIYISFFKALNSFIFSIYARPPIPCLYSGALPVVRPPAPSISCSCDRSSARVLATYLPSASTKIW